MSGRRFRRLVPLLVAALALAACGEDADPVQAAPSVSPSAAGGTGKVRVAAASDLKFALEEIKTSLTAANPGVQVELTFGSSGQFVQQIQSGAPFDLYLSADRTLAQGLAAAGLADPADVFDYAVGRVVIWAPSSSGVDPTRGFDALRDPAATKVAIANPEHAPYGRAAMAAMKTAGVYGEVEPKLVLGENIAQTAEFIASGNAPVGIIALSLALAPELSSKGRYYEVPLDSFPRLDQGGVVLSRAQDLTAARTVRDFLRSPAGIEILKKYGFFLPGAGAPSATPAPTPPTQAPTPTASESAAAVSTPTG